MKIIYSISIFLILIIPSISFATSGTCSFHGGVKCSAGADFDGSAICNDGWRDSSESFYDQNICAITSYTPTCYLPTKKDFYCSNVAGTATTNGLRYSSDDPTPQCEANQKQADSEYQESYRLYKQCFLEKGYNVDTQLIDTSLINQIEQEKKQAIIDAKEKLQIEKDLACRQQYNDFNSHEEGNNCVCNTGYVLYKNDGVCELKKTEVVVQTFIPEKQVIMTEVAQTVPVVESIKKEFEKPLFTKKSTNKTTITVKSKETTVPQNDAKEVSIPIQTEVKKVSFLTRFFNWITGKNKN